MAAKAPKKSRKKPLVRGEAVVRRALHATLHELSSAGYAALRVEDIATRARVNKTTIYRRWSTKEALVRAALLSIREGHKDLPIPDTGSVRDDLMTVVRRTLTLARSREGKVTMRMVLAESPHSKLGRIAESVRKGHDSIPLAIFQRARKRGELRAGVDPSLLFEVLRSACMQMILRTGEIKERFIEQLVDVLLVGALHRKAVNTRRKSRRE